MTKYPRGSEWRKWDLHIHSNASDGLSSPKEIIDEAKKKGLSVIALTDHHTVDNVDEIKKIAEQENSGITVIAGIEFRSEYGEKSVHFIGLFPDSHEGTILNSTALRDLILSPLGISKTAVIAKGRENDPSLDDNAAFKKGMFSVQVDFKEAANLIHRYGGVISIHNGSKSNGLDTEVKHRGVGPHNVKELCESLGTLKEELLKEYVDICEIRKENDSESFYLDTFNLPSITASDAHKTSEIGQKSVWIKGDPTFDGLKQILYEPEDRVRIQEDCPEFKPMYNLIDKVSLNENGFWNQDILINENLSVIIGGRSTGKSTLLESIARKVNGSQNINIEENNIKRNEFFESHLEGISVLWKDNSSNSERHVDYFPQNHMYEIAKDSKKVDELIHKIITETESNKIVLSKLESETKNTSAIIRKKCTELYTLHKDLIGYNEMIRTAGNVSGIEQTIKVIQEKANSLKSSSGMTEEDLKVFETKNELLSREMAAKKDLINDISIIESLKQTPLLDSSINYEFNNLSFDQRDLLQKNYEEFAAATQKGWIKILDDVLVSTKQHLALCEKSIQEISNNPIYIKGKEYIAANKQYATYQEQLALENDRLKSAKSLIGMRDTVQKQIDTLKNELISNHCAFKNMIQLAADAIQINAGGLSVKAKPQLRTEDLRDYLQPKLIKRSDNQKRFISELSDNYIDNTENKIKSLIDGLLDQTIQCTSGNYNYNVLQDFLAENWYTITYDLLYQEDDFASMSPGKQAFVILKLLLEFSSRKCPILIDQPEDSLDNRAIYSELVSYLKTKKKERQIILVSHNPNVVVGSDAEQVIVANQNGIKTINQDNIKFQYISGSLENSSPKIVDETCILLSQGIREHVCDILEGGKEAFNRREKKYGFMR